MSILCLIIGMAIEYKFGLIAKGMSYIGRGEKPTLHDREMERDALKSELTELRGY